MSESQQQTGSVTADDDERQKQCGKLKRGSISDME
jgi:hypothetical protein